MEAHQGVCALCPQPDCNSNKCHMVDSQQSMLTSSSQRSSCSDSLLHDSGEYQWCLDYGYNRDCNSKKHQGILSYHENQISAYDDISKNIDANLAEIDMETFCSEDIHSILAIPAIFSGDFENGHGEKCASVSGSFTGCLELDSSVSPPSTSEDDGSAAEMSICKDEPLFSPLKEHILPVGTISTDSLDCSSFEEHDLVLTCRANKNNYTIAFEGSSIQFSDDSDYLEAEQSSEGEGCLFHDRAIRLNGPSMIHSDLGFTTWSKLRRVKETGGKTSGGKSQSLPNLLRQSTDQCSWEHCMPLYDVQKSQTDSTDSRVSLLKLFIQHKQSSSLSMSSSQSDASSCKLNLSGNIRSSQLEESNCNSVDGGEEEDINVAFVYQNKFTDNEANNNNNVQKPLDNNNVETTAESDEDNSQYFEDSLVETRTTSIRAVYASPIKEEEEPLESDTSSSDATMRDSKDPFGSDSSEESSLNKNQKPNRFVSQPNKQGAEGTIQEDAIPINLSQATQTRQMSEKHLSEETGSGSTLGLYRSVDVSDKEVQGDGLGSLRMSHTSSYRNSSTSSNSSQKKRSVLIATTRTCGTQIPVHIKDHEAQTQTEKEPSESWSFTHKEGPEVLELPFNEEGDTQSDRKSIYVCYPNYSLPDLSFLRKMTASPEHGERVILKPARHRLPEKQPARRRSYSSEGKSRPRSCGDCIAGGTFSHIKDWESLNTLLPAEYRSLISQMRRPHPNKTSGSGPCDNPHMSYSLSSSSVKKPSNETPPPPIPERSMSLPVSEPSRRSILRKSSSASHCTTGHSCGPQKCQSSPAMPWAEEAHQKRLSLQEPFQCLLDNIPEASCFNDNRQESNFKSSSRHSLAGQCIVGNKASHQLSRAASEGCWGRTCPCSVHQQHPHDNETAAEVHRLLESDASLHLAAAFLSEHQLEDSGYDQRCNCSRNKKTVSFCENVDVHFKGHHNCSKVEQHVDGCTCLCPVHACSGRKTELPDDATEEIKPGSISYSKSIYLQRIKLAVNHILNWFNSTPQNASSKPPLESLVVSQLCSALYALLADGLLTSVQGLFGPLSNTPWRIAEMSCQQRAGTNCKELLELLAYVNGEESLKNHIFKFNAFILGLLNLPGLLEQWLICLLSCSHLVQHNYSPTGFLFLTSLPQFVTLRDDLLHYIHPLTYLAFSMDIHAAASVSPTEFVSACQRHDDESPRPGRRARPLSCIEVSNNEHPSVIKPSNSWECGGVSFDENLNATPGYTPPAVESPTGPEGSTKYSPTTSGDSGCSSPPPDVQDGDSFQQLRQKWEQLATHPPQPELTASKPPLPTSPYRDSKKVSTPTKNRKQQQQAESSPRTLRSKLPSPVRSGEGGRETPESPTRQRGGAQARSSSPPSVAGTGRSSRRSFIPVHRPGVRGNSGKR